MKKPQYPVVPYTKGDYYELDLEDISTLGDLREKTSTFPDSVRFHYSEGGGGYFYGHTAEYEERVQAAMTKYNDELAAYEKWRKTTPEYLEQQESIRAVAEKQKQYRIYELERELEKLRK